MPFQKPDLKAYRYHLPPDKIPDRPLPERDQSKLLVYRKGSVSHTVFQNITSYLPTGSLLVFNNSRVIPARLFFSTPNGATIEVLCLQPEEKESYNAEQTQQIWRCIIGNLKRWKAGDSLTVCLGEYFLNANLIEKGGEENKVLFSWNRALTFLEILEKAGQIPLPPYMNRNADQEDSIRYQTVYATHPGSVAAPTAGLHFTPAIMEELKKSGHQTAHVTLHVGAGTFKPIKTDDISEHKMHEELFEVDEDFLNLLLQAECVIPVGTTSMRTIESLCILGTRFRKGDFALEVNQWDGFTEEKISVHDAISSVLLWMKQNEKTRITVKTSIMIIPGYKFRACKGLITNFHQPESTLILLVAAFLGENWKKVYDYALNNDFRFLSYGDSSILLPET